MVRGSVIPSQVTQDLEDTLIPWMLMRSNSLSFGKGKCHRVHEMVVSSAVEKIQRDCDARKGNGKQSSGKGQQSNSWSKSDGKGKSKESKGKSKGKSKRFQRQG